MMKRNVVKEDEQIYDQVEQDQEIDLEKIKKTFKNVINDQRFIRNYEKIKSGNPSLKNAKDRKNYRKREKQIHIAKCLFSQQIRKQPYSHLNNLLDNIRLETLESDDIVNSSAFNGLSMRENTKSQNDKQDQASDDSGNTIKRGNDFNHMLEKGIFR